MRITSALASFSLFAVAAIADDQFVTFEPWSGAGEGKKIVLLAGDEEYRSEEALPQLAKILSVRHGFPTTVILPVNSGTGEIDPQVKDNAPGIEALDSAALCIMLLRFRAWPDEQMKHFVDYYLAGKPIIALRTSTHAFDYSKNPDSAYAKYHWQAKDWVGGFGKQVLGETWVSHHGDHKKEGTRGVIEPAAKNNPILRGVENVFGDTDVYTAAPPSDATILLRGQVTQSLDPASPAVTGKKNSPMQPIAWLREPANEAGKKNRVFVTTMGSATDLANEGFRRLLVNAAYALTGLEVPDKADVDLVDDFQPTAYGFNGHKKGVKPADLK